MHEDHFWLLIARHLAGETSPIEEEELRSLIESSIEHRIRFETILKFWGRSKQHDEAEVIKAYQKVKAKIKVPHAGKARFKAPVPLNRNPRRMVQWVVAAAFAIGLVATGILLREPSIEPGPVWTSKINAKGERSTILLADGSTVWLNADSRLEYPKAFTDGTREVYLEGEGFFDITSDPNCPFIIHLDDGLVRVLGTSFNVKAFKYDNKVETSVVTGKVGFIPRPQGTHNHRDTILITPNQKVVYFKESRKVVQKPTDGNEDKAWVDGRLVFRSSPFSEIAQILERSFGKKIVFDNEGLRSCLLTGTFQNNSLEEIMTLLAETKDYTYTITGDEIRISGTGCPGDP